MPGGYRSIVAAALAVLIFISLGLGYYAGSLNYPQQEQYPRYERSKGEPQQVTWTSPITERTKYSEPCKEPQRRDESDLCAQWKAARAAEASALWAKAGFWLGIVGTLGLLLTLFYTRQAVLAAEAATKDADRALHIAERNADAADRQVAISADTAKRQLRAYVGTLAATVTNCAVGEKIAIRVDLQNSGQTPAYRLEGLSALIMHFADAELELPTPDTSNMRESYVAPGGKLHLYASPDAALTENEYNQIKRGELSFYFLGHVSYFDVFGERHTLRIAFEGSEPERGGDLKPCATHNDSD